MGDTEEYERESENDWYDTLFAHLVMLFVLLIGRVWLEYNCNSCMVSFGLMLHIPVVPNVTLLSVFVRAEKCNIPECQSGWLHADYVREKTHLAGSTLGKK